jgi:hypothetical protein
MAEATKLSSTMVAKVMVDLSLLLRAGKHMSRECNLWVNDSDRLDWWAQRNACGDKTEEVIQNGDVHHLSWSCGGIDGLLQHYKVDSMGEFEPTLVLSSWQSY